MESLCCQRATPGEPMRTLRAGEVWVLNQSWDLLLSCSGLRVLEQRVCKENAAKKEAGSSVGRGRRAWAGSPRPRSILRHSQEHGPGQRASTRGSAGPGSLQAPRCPRRAAFLAEFIGVFFSTL